MTSRLIAMSLRPQPPTRLPLSKSTTINWSLVLINLRPTATPFYPTFLHPNQRPESCLSSQPTSSHFSTPYFPRPPMETCILACWERCSRILHQLYNQWQNLVQRNGNSFFYHWYRLHNYVLLCRSGPSWLWWHCQWRRPTTSALQLQIFPRVHQS